MRALLRVPVADARAQARARIGYVSQKFALYGNDIDDTTTPLGMCVMRTAE